MPKLRVYQRLFPLLSLLFLWPALFNGTPFFYPDTSTYIRGADAAVYFLTGHTTGWSQTVQNQTGTSPAPAASGKSAQSAPAEPSGKTLPGSSFGKNILLGRSIYYGLFLYLGVIVHSLWFPAILQALIAGFAIVGAIRHLVDPVAEPRRFAALTAGAMAAGALTPLPYYVSMLMPDVFSGLIILAATVILCGWKRELLGWRLFWFGLLVMGGLGHSSHVPVIAGLAVLGLIFAWLWRQPLPWAGAALIGSTVLISFAGEAAFSKAIEHSMGHAPIRPPFLATRLIADGPGEAYVRETCPGSGSIYCGYQSQLSRYSDDMLWVEDPRIGIFSASSAEVQRRLASEDSHFAIEVARHYPLWTLQTAARNAVRQLTMGGLSEFNLRYDPVGMATSGTPRDVADALLASRSNHGGMPTWAYRAYGPVLILLSLAILASAFFVKGLRPWRMPVALLLSGILVNAVVCGVLSGAYERYQDRVMWVPVVAAAILLLASARSLGRRSQRIRAPG